MNNNMQDTVNEKAKRIVNQDVFAKVDSMVRYILAQDDHNAPFSYDNVEYNKPDYDSMEEKELDEILRDEYDENPEDYDDFDDKVIFLDDNYETPEIFEYWLVSNWLADKLRDQGETIIDDYTVIWGRSTTGQAIYLDGVIQQIAKNLQS